MTTIFERVENALATVSPAINYSSTPYKGALPNAYVTHQLLTSPPELHADNVELERSYTIQLNYWDISNIPSTTSVDAAMLAAGFQKNTVRQLPQDQQTNHYGLAVEYIYLEQE